MDIQGDAIKILLEEYGILNLSELDAAIAGLGFVDIFSFCGAAGQHGKENTLWLEEIDDIGNIKEISKS